MPDGTNLTRVVSLLQSRLDDGGLAAVVTSLAADCNARPGCARVLQQQREEVRTLSGGGTSVQAASVSGTDVVVSGYWNLLFGTPTYFVTLGDYESLNAHLLRLLEEEYTASQLNNGIVNAARSLVGNGWRTPDDYLQRGDPAIRILHAHLLEHAHNAAQYAQPRRLSVKLSLSGWAVALGSGGSMREHVHPLATWSGVYYVAVPPRASGSSGGCLRFSDPRPGAQMVTLGPGDEQFMESRLVCPRAGMLVLFPAWLPHSVVPLSEQEASQTEQQQQHGGGKEGLRLGSGAPLSRVAVAFNVHGGQHQQQ